jgi:DMSO/TMAO reductase YedYZ molybdopterin-dependent catalytic subunit
MKKNRTIQLLAVLLTGATLFALGACNKKGNGKEKTTARESTTTELQFTAVTDAPVAAAPGSWRIEIRGVDTVTQFTSEDAKYLPKMELEMTTTNSSGFTVTNKYGGITLRSLLSFCNVTNVSNVAVTSIDGYAANYNAAMAMAEDTLLAWEMDGAPIDTEPPLRMCPRSGTAEMYVQLVTSISVSVLPPEQLTTTTPSTYAEYYPSYVYVPSYYYTTSRTTTTKATTSVSTTTSTDPSTESTATTTATTTTTKRSTSPPYVYTNNRTTTTKAMTTYTTRPTEWWQGPIG